MLGRFHGAVPVLRRTNIPGYDATVSGVAFDASLGRAAYLVTQSGRSGETPRVRRFRADTLAAAAKHRRAAHERPRSAVAIGWRLRPSWALHVIAYQSGNRIRYKLLCVPRLHDKYADAVEAGNAFASAITLAPGFAATWSSVSRPLGQSVFKATPERYGNTTVLAVPSPKCCSPTNTDFPS